ncbi:ADP-ribosyltransferase domain-containing protein [uncultured Microbacterium sp.]|uniref:ADP-ribosyltransferase domain-containing protein n=1 Tax=uncultured Microbacterium sp. TaxID=191216 RepID=UPI0025D79992|nr:ADP-ribosyltransferase domain-containing protein [uncultured Microbacterium sp.]
MSNALIAGPVDTATPFSGAGLLDSGTQLAHAIESGNWVEGGLAAFSTAVDTVAAVIDPLGSLIAAGLGWLIDHFEPIKGWFNDLTGDAGAVMGFSQTWTNVQTQLDSTADFLDRVVTDLDDMAGEAIEAYRRFQVDAAAHIRASGQWAGAMATGLQIASTIVQVVHDLVRDILSQLVGSAISWATQAVVTVGLATPWIITQVSTRVASWTAKISSKLTGLLRSCGKLGDLLGELRALMSRGEDMFRRVPRPAARAATPRTRVGEEPRVAGTPADDAPPHGGVHEQSPSTRRADDDPEDPLRSDDATPEQIAADEQALRDYTGPLYIDINKALRGQIPMTPELQAAIDGAVRALDRLPDHPGTVLRGERLEPGATYIDAYQPGRIVTNESFTSADIDRAFPGQVQYEIESVHGKSVQHLSRFADEENEVLFKPGTSFEVIRRREVDGQIQIYMREVP